MEISFATHSNYVIKFLTLFCWFTQTPKTVWPQTCCLGLSGYLWVIRCRIFWKHGLQGHQSQPVRILIQYLQCCSWWKLTTRYNCSTINMRLLKLLCELYCYTEAIHHWCKAKLEWGDIFVKRFHHGPWNHVIKALDVFWVEVNCMSKSFCTWLNFNQINCQRSDRLTELYSMGQFLLT